MRKVFWTRRLLRGLWDDLEGLLNMKLQEKYSGSTILIVLGVLFFILGIASVIPGAEATGNRSGVIIGLPIVFGALAYRSAKKRKFLIKDSSVVKIMLEVIYLSISILPVVYIGVSIGERASREIVSQNPHIMLWVGVVVAYFLVVFFGKTSDVD